MRSHCLLRTLIVCVCCLAVSVGGAGAIAMSVDPAAVDRGTDLLLRVAVVNDTGSPIDLPTLSIPLPVGIDQWRTEVRVDGSVWIGFPANGLIGLSPLTPGDVCEVEVRAAVETAAPAELGFEAELITPTACLMTASMTVNVRPSVDAGADRVSTPGTTVSLIGASAHDGGAPMIAYLWDDGGVGGLFDDPTMLTPAYEPPDGVAQVELTLTATDEGGDTGCDSLRLHINLAPTIDLGGDLSAAEGQTINLSGVVSDEDGWILSVLWSDNGAGGRFEPSAEVLDVTYIPPELTGCDDAKIELTLTVTDDWGTTTTDSIWLTLENTHAEPTVDAGAERSVLSGETVDLIGEILESEDPVVDTTWTQISGPGVTLFGVSGADASFVAPSVTDETVLVFEFSASTLCGAGGNDEVMIRVQPLPGEDPEDPENPENPDDPQDPDDPEDPANPEDPENPEDPGDPEDPEDPGDPEDPDDPTHPSQVSLHVALELRDDLGFEIRDASQLRANEPVHLLISATNDGAIELRNVQASINGGPAMSFVRRTLAPWETTRATYEIPIHSDDLEYGLILEVQVSATDADGNGISITERIALLGRAPAASLELRLASISETASSGQTLELTATVRNSGASTVSGIELRDGQDRVFERVWDPMDPGGSIVVTYLIEIPGSAAHEWIDVRATASGFASNGEPVSDTALLSIWVDGATDDGASGDGGQAAGLVSNPQRVAINEIAWCGTPASPDDEWIELVNLTGKPIDLDGWTIRWLTSSSGDWVSIPLSGRIGGLPYASSLGGDARHITFLPSDEEGLWRVLHLAWWGVEASSGVGQGFYVIERGDDDTVMGVPAGVTYDQEYSLDFALPDQGTQVELIDASGAVADRIDALSGWPAGGGVTAASMERLHLQQRGSMVEWNSSPGVFRSGMDREGRMLSATAGLPNSPSLDALMELALSRVEFVEVSGSTSVTIPTVDRFDRPRIHLSVAAGELAVGGGGSTGVTPQVWQRWRSDEGLALGFDHLPAGRFLVWIVDPDGLRLLPIESGS